jgi:transcriptional regulator with XRE-family HTH domain
MTKQHNTSLFSNMESRERLGKKIRILRETLSMSQSDLAEALGYAPGNTMISQIERGQKGMSLDKIKAVAKIFKVPYVVLLSEDEYTETDLEMFVNLQKVIKSGDSKHKDSIKLLLSAAVKD